MIRTPEVFAAIDFETADYGADSACSIAVIRVERGQIVRREQRLIRPPRRNFIFTYVHGLSWTDVEQAPVFSDVWQELRGLLDGAEFIAAHNASFDRKVLSACCYAAGWGSPDLRWLCTVQLSRRQWALPSNSLPNVCRHLGLQLKHHEALSDAEACANIVLAAMKDGADVLAEPVKKRAKKPAVRVPSEVLE